MSHCKSFEGRVNIARALFFFLALVPAVTFSRQQTSRSDCATDNFSNYQVRLKLHCRRLSGSLKRRKKIQRKRRNVSVIVPRRFGGENSKTSIHRTSPFAVERRGCAAGRTATLSSALRRDSRCGTEDSRACASIVVHEKPFYRG